ncbi:MAG: DNA primase [Flavobacteriales bacterium]
MIPKETIEEIFRTARIEDVVEDFVPLRKAGSDYKALSPFTNEKTPSFMISPSKQIFKDFSSGKGGNVVTFLMEHEQLSYPEALRFLARRYNITVPEEDDEEAREEQKEKESLFIITEFAERYFREQLQNTDEGRSVGLQYFRERGYDDASIEAFKLGYAPKGWEQFTQKALEKGYKLDYLQRTGLTKVKEGTEKRFDFFRERVMFPIHDITGRTVGFGGRLLRKDQKAPKYLNSPESPIYDKSSVLYGLYQAKKEIAHEDRAYLVEGYTDVIALHQAGVKNVAATSGTSLTKQQVRLLKRFSKNVTLLFDGDEAGQKATERGLDLFLEEGMNVRVLLLPEGEDPDSFSKELDPETLKSYFDEEAQDLIRYKASLSAEEAKNDPVRKAEWVKGVTDSIALIPDHILRSFYIRECGQTLDVDEQALVMEVNKARRQRLKSKRERQEEEAAINDDQEEVHKEQPKESGPIAPIPQEEELIRLMIEHSERTLQVPVQYEEEGEEQEEEVPLPTYVLNELDADSIQMKEPRHQQILEIFREIEGETLPASKVMELLLNRDPTLQEYAVHLTTSKESISPKWRDKRVHPPAKDEKLLKIVDNGIIALKEKRIEAMLEALQERFNKVENNEEEERLLWEQGRLIEAKKEFNKRLNRVIIK